MLKCQVDMFDDPNSTIEITKADAGYEIEVESDGENVILFFTKAELSDFMQAIEEILI